MSNGYLLDTNVPSELRKPFPDHNVIAWVASHDDLHLSVISIAELRRGFSILPQSKRRAQLEKWFHDFLMPLVDTRVLPVTQTIAERWGLIGGKRERNGLHFHWADGLIAATALEHNLTVVTRNVRDFEGLDVTICNPWDA